MNHKELTDRQLLAYLDGEATAEEVAFIEQRPEEQTRVKEWADLQKKLITQLHPLKPPSSIELGEYQIGLLPAEKETEIAQYLEDFRYAGRELELLGRFLSEPDFPSSVVPTLAPQPSLVSTLKVLFAKLTQGGLGLAGVRGGESIQLDSHQLEEGVYEVDEILISINIEDDQMQLGHRALFGYVEADTLPSDALLWRSNQPDMVAQASVDDDGDFHISGLQRGRYQLILVGHEIEIHLPELNF